MHTFLIVNRRGLLQNTQGCPSGAALPSLKCKHPYLSTIFLIALLFGSEI